MNEFKQAYTQAVYGQRQPRYVAKYVSTKETRQQTGKWRQRMLNPLWVVLEEERKNG